jgi:hypothetical protein
MLIVPARHLTLVAAHVAGMGVDSEVFATGSNNYLDVTVKVPTMYAVGTPPTAHLLVSVYGSNDGNGWFALPDFSTEDITAGSGVTEFSGDATTAFIRFHFAHTVTGSSPGDWATVFLCCQANLVHR